MFEKEAIDFYHKLIKEEKDGDWKNAPPYDNIIKELKEKHRTKVWSKETFKNELGYDYERHGGSPQEFFEDLYYPIFRNIKKYCGKPQTILEIGGRYGGLCKMLNWKKYHFLDLPEMLPIAYWFLKNNNKSVNFVAPWDLPKLNDKIDLLINSRSFQHMDIKNLRYYFKEIERIKPTYLFLYNRNKTIDSTDVIIDKYPIPNIYELIYSSGGKYHTKIYKLNG